MKRKGTLSIRWTRHRDEGVSPINGEQGDVLYEWGEGCHKADGSLLHYWFGCGRREMGPRGEIEWSKSLIEELHERGYDLTTLKLSIRKRSGASSLPDQDKETR